MLLRKTTSVVCSAIIALATIALPGYAQNKQEAELAILHLTITSQNLGSPCQGQADKVCVKINWTVNNVPTAKNIGQFRIFVNATNGNPASKNKAEATANAADRTVTVKLAPVAGGFTVHINALSTSSQVLAQADATGTF